MNARFSKENFIAAKLTVKYLQKVFLVTPNNFVSVNFVSLKLDFVVSNNSIWQAFYFLLCNSKILM